jgi:hypothetical protein
MSVEKQRLETLMYLAEEVRKSQKAYFKSRTQTNLKHSLARENILDKYIETLKDLGYEAKNDAGKIEQQTQSNLF